MEYTFPRLQRKIDRLKAIAAERARIDLPVDPSLFEFGNTKGPDGTTRPVVNKPLKESKQ